MTRYNRLKRTSSSDSEEIILLDRLENIDNEFEHSQNNQNHNKLDEGGFTRYDNSIYNYSFSVENLKRNLILRSFGWAVFSIKI